MTHHIYGVDLEKPINPQDVRDALEECFLKAHSEILKETMTGDLPANEQRSLERLNVRQMIRNYFQDVDGDYDKPTKETILGVIENMKVFAKNFRQEELIEKHAGQIMELVNRLP